MDNNGAEVKGNVDVNEVVGLLHRIANNTSSEDLVTILSSIDTNLERIANGIERISVSCRVHS